MRWKRKGEVVSTTSKKSKYHQGKYKPVNPRKYKGDLNNIVFRSSWELNYFRYCDTNSNILKWSSESVVIPYVSPIDGEYHRYFMDVYMKYRTKLGLIEEVLIEIKPYDQTQPPKPQKRKTKVWPKKEKLKFGKKRLKLMRSIKQNGKLLLNSARSEI